MFDQGAVRQWLAILHGGAPGLINICSTGNWTGASFPTGDPDAAADYAAQLDARGREGIYARVTTVHELGASRIQRGERGGVEDTCALPALWADVDLAGPGHKEANLPPDEGAARQLLTHTGLPEPTLWVHSGGGRYPIWLLDQPHPVAGDLADLVDLSAGWQRVIGAAAGQLGWHYGTGVGDLARVLRIPGTVNRKAGLERPCRIVSATGTRYPLAALYGAAADALAGLAPDPEADPHPVRWGSCSAFAAALRSWSNSQGEVWDRSPNGAWQRRGEVVNPPDHRSPGDDYAARTDWADILQPHGWRLAYQRGHVRYWRRPGKDTPGISATTNALGTDRLRVFSTSTQFLTESYSKLGAFAVLEHGGDLKAAAKALQDSGFGTPGPAEAQREAMAGVLGYRLPETVHGRPIEHVELPDQPPPPPLDADLLAEVHYREEVAAEARRQRIRRDARAHLEAEDYERTWREPTSTLTLTQELEQPDEPVAYRIQGLLPAGGNAIIAAQFKAGKTTMINNLARSLADGEPFLNRFTIEPPDGRIAIWNYEVGAGQFRRWLRDIGVSNTDQVCVLNVRGYRLPPTVPQVEAWIVKWLTDHDVSVWIVDPFARAFTGSGEENSNSDVGLFLDSLDVIKERAQISELVLPVHTGRAEQEQGQERARGATRLDDWADARWLLTVDDQGRRYFRAAGRDVDVDEELLTHDPDTHRLTIGGWDRRGMQVCDLAGELACWVAENPGLGTNEIVDGVGKGRSRVVAALQSAIAVGAIIIVGGPGRKRLHYPPGVVS